MKIIVCIKQVNDPEAPSSSLRIDPETNKILPPPGGIQPVISTFDEYAIEAALRIKEKVGGEITALSLGENLSRDVVKKPLAMGADDLVLLEDPSFFEGDSWANAYALSCAIRKVGEFDLILCGRQAADTDSGQVGLGIAEILGLPSVSIARKVEVENNKARVEKVISDGFEVIEVRLPAVITLSNEHASPRYPNIKGIMMAKNKEPIVWGPSDIGADPSRLGIKGSRIKLLKLFQPVREGKCEIVTADTPEEAAVKLAETLREAKVF